MEEAVYLKEENNNLYIRTSGHVTAGISAALRRRVFQRLMNQPEPDHIYVDLSACEYMDSTFMGLLVGFNKTYEKTTGRKIEIPLPSGECMNLLKNLGIHTLLNIENEEVSFPEDMENISQTDTATTEFILKTHENLIELSEENRKRFALLHQILKKKLDGDGEPPPEQS